MLSTWTVSQPIVPGDEIAATWTNLALTPADGYIQMAVYRHVPDGMRLDRDQHTGGFVGRRTHRRLAARERAARRSHV